MQEIVKEYCRSIGWDYGGIPASSELRRLGLRDTDKKLKQIRGSPSTTLSMSLLKECNSM